LLALSAGWPSTVREAISPTGGSAAVGDAAAGGASGEGPGAIASEEGMIDNLARTVKCALHRREIPDPEVGCAQRKIGWW
jgi:hypothetical protein